MYCTNNNEINTSHSYFYNISFKLAVKYVCTNNNNKAIYYYFLLWVYICIILYIKLSCNYNDSTISVAIGLLLLNYTMYSAQHTYDCSFTDHKL